MNSFSYEFQSPLILFLKTKVTGAQGSKLELGTKLDLAQKRKMKKETQINSEKIRPC